MWLEWRNIFRGLTLMVNHTHNALVLTDIQYMFVNFSLLTLQEDFTVTFLAYLVMAGTCATCLAAYTFQRCLSLSPLIITVY